MSSAVTDRPLLTIREVAEQLAVSEKTIRRLVDRGELPALRVGAQIRIDAAQLEEWLHGDEEVTRIKEAILAALDRGDTGELERLRSEYRRVAVIERPATLGLEENGHA